MKSIDFARIGRKLKEIRISKNLTQEYIANMADVNVSHISNIENNRVKISLPTLVHVCNALDTTVDYILFEEYEHPTSVLETEILHEVHLCTPETQVQILKMLSGKLNDALSGRLFYADFGSHGANSHFKNGCFCELFS